MSPFSIPKNLCTFITILFSQFNIIPGYCQTAGLSEFQFSNDQFEDENGAYHPWVEIANLTETPINLSNYSISTCRDCTQDTLHTYTLEGNSQTTIWLSGNSLVDGHSSITVNSQTKSIYIFDIGSASLVDSLIIYSIPDPGTSIARSPDTHEWYYYPEEKVSFGSQNPILGNWRQVLNAAAFSIGDSGRFGCLVHHNKMYILDYETRDENGNWYVLPEVWHSENGREWERVNSSPPYSHGALFVSFNDSIFAFDGTVYKSFDGIAWEKIAEERPVFTRMASFKDELYGIKSNSLYRSSDGVNWDKIIDDLPWYYRSNPAFLSFNNKLWAYGGSIYYGSNYELYFKDVWYSEDGLNWHLATNKAPWDGGGWFTYAAFDNKLWMLGGYNFYRELAGIEFGNTNAIWFSEDGQNWTNMKLANSWSARHAPFTWVYENNLWVAAGYGGGGTSRLYNDVWRFEKFNQNLDVQISGGPTSTGIVATYGDLPVELDITSHSAQPISFYSNKGTIVFVANNAVNILNAGQDTLSVVQAGNEFYYPEVIDIPVTINKKSISVTPSDITRNFLANTPAISLLFEGFVNGDTEEDLQQLPTPVSNTDFFSPVGDYPITLTGGFDSNYQYVYKEGTLRIIGESALNAFPNPTTDLVNIVFAQAQSKTCHVTIADSSGKTLSSYHSNGSNAVTINTQLFEPGFYFLKSDGCDVNKTTKLIIE